MNCDKLNVLSLFNGMGCIWLALDKLGININTRYISEIDKYANTVNNYHYPDSIQLGDVNNLEIDTLKPIDLLVGGSPCQGFSSAGKGLNFNDPRSKLFFKFVDVLKTVTPKYFLLENVVMKKEYEDHISDILGCKPIKINSLDFTGLIRKRLYWTNIPVDDLPFNMFPKTIEDVIDNDLPFNISLDKILSKTIYNPRKSGDGIININSRNSKNKQTWQRGRVYDIKGNCPTICASLYDLNITKDHKTYRKLTIQECEKLQGVPVGYTSMVSNHQAGKMLGNGWTVDVISFLLKNMNF